MKPTELLKLLEQEFPYVVIRKFTVHSGTHPLKYLGLYTHSQLQIDIYRDNLVSQHFAVMHEFAHAIQFQTGLIHEWYGTTENYNANCFDPRLEPVKYRSSAHESHADQFAYSQGDKYGLWAPGYEIRGMAKRV